MKRYNIVVNGKAYDVQVEEAGAGAAPMAPAPVAAPAPAPVAAPAPAAAPAAPAGPGYGTDQYGQQAAPPWGTPAAPAAPPMGVQPGAVNPLTGQPYYGG